MIIIDFLDYFPVTFGEKVEELFDKINFRDLLYSLQLSQIRSSDLILKNTDEKYFYQNQVK